MLLAILGRMTLEYVERNSPVANIVLLLVYLKKKKKENPTSTVLQCSKEKRHKINRTGCWCVCVGGGDLMEQITEFRF